MSLQEEASHLRTCIVEAIVQLRIYLALISFQSASFFQLLLLIGSICGQEKYEKHS